LDKKDIIKEVKETEEKARQIVKDARKEARLIIEKAHTDAASMWDEAKSQMTSKREEAIKAARKEADREIAKLGNKREAEKREFLKKARDNEEKAVDFLFEKVVNL